MIQLKPYKLVGATGIFETLIKKSLLKRKTIFEKKNKNEKYQVLNQDELNTMIMRKKLVIQRKKDENEKKELPVIEKLVQETLNYQENSLKNDRIWKNKTDKMIINLCKKAKKDEDELLINKDLNKKMQKTNMIEIVENQNKKDMINSKYGW